MVSIDRILCPVDFSSFSRHALEHASAIAKWYDSDLVVLHVAPTPPQMTPPPICGISAAVPIDLAEEEQRLAGELETFMKPVVPTMRNVSMEGQVGGPVFQILEQVAKDRNADLIVMGVLGRNAVDLAVFGSTTQHVVRSAGCPVLTMRG